MGPLLCLLVWCCSLAAAPAQSNFTFRVMACNLTGGSQKYEAPQIRILQGLKPDIVAIQEFNYQGNSTAEIRSFVDTAFGTNFVYFRENNAEYSIPNGVISRWPIVNNGSWDDPLLPNRGFAWAQIDLPGTNDLYVVSVHLYNGGSATDRNTEALTIKSQVQTTFPAQAWVIVAGDMNTDSRSEAAITTFKTFLSDSPIPTDDNGDDDTNLNRNKPYDYVLPSFSMTNTLTNVVLGAHSFPQGLVFDSRVYTPLNDVSPVQISDSAQGQHMAVLKDFHVNDGGTNAPPPSTPGITDPPDSLTVTEGDDASFYVTASGADPLSFQWRFEAAAIAGATNSSYTRFNAQLSDAGNYTVVVTNHVGSTTSKVAVLTVNPPSTGTSNVIAQWDFNEATLQPSIGSGSATYVGGTAANSSGEFASGSSFDPTSGNNQAWNTSSYPGTTTGNKTAGVQFNLSTAGRTNLSVAWDSRASNTGSKYGRLQYTTNGTTFVDFPISVVNSTSFTRHTNHLQGVAGVADNPSFAFRIVSEFENTASGAGTAGYVAANPASSYSSGGTMRFDMVTVYGTVISTSPPPPATLGNPVRVNDQFQFEVTGRAGADYIIQTSTNLASGNWIPVWTNTAPFLYVATNTAAESLQYFRAQSQP